MSMTPLEREILSDAVDDWFGLWEATAQARRLLPSMSDAERHELSRDTLKKMVKEGLIFLCFFKHEGNWEVRIPMEKTDYVLDDVTNWQPEGGWHIRFAATEKGQKVYYALPRVD
jgi:hypothetical protein